MNSDHGLAARDRRSENVRISAVIVAELKFRDVQRQVFGAIAHPVDMQSKPSTMPLRWGDTASSENPPSDLIR